jgi:hypothetical protein
MDVVEPRAGLWLTQVHLQRATRKGNRRNQEQADLDHTLTCEQGRLGRHEVLTAVAT